ncbi:hypothetical protein [Dendronalium sp. ChiSLP03b]|uniref:hypothetical protein n=1 Tax=Dendronalium sp. ChiSLP03b TaxID=3075381 RepID=UPI00391A42D9
MAERSPFQLGNFRYQAIAWHSTFNQSAYFCTNSDNYALLQEQILSNPNSVVGSSKWLKPGLNGQERMGTDDNLKST